MTRGVCAPSDTSKNEQRVDDFFDDLASTSSSMLRPCIRSSAFDFILNFAYTGGSVMIGIVSNENRFSFSRYANAVGERCR